MRLGAPQKAAAFGLAVATLALPGCGVTGGRTDLEVDGAALKVVRSEETYFFVPSGSFSLRVLPLPFGTSADDPRFADIARHAADQVAARRCGRPARRVSSSSESGRWWAGLHHCSRA